MLAADLFGAHRDLDVSVSQMCWGLAVSLSLSGLGLGLGSEEMVAMARVHGRVLLRRE